MSLELGPKKRLDKNSTPGGVDSLTKEERRDQSIHKVADPYSPEPPRISPETIGVTYETEVPLVVLRDLRALKLLVESGALEADDPKKIKRH